MKYEQKIKELQLKVEEVSKKYEKLKQELPASHHQEMEDNDPLQQAMKKLELLNEEIQEHYAQLNQEENRNVKKMSEIERIIYDTIESFNHEYNSGVGYSKVNKNE